MKTCTVCGIEKPEEMYSRRGTEGKRRANCKTCQEQYRRLWRDRTPGIQYAAARRSNLKHKFGMTIDQWEEMLVAQGNKCACCSTTEPGGQGRFHVDHCHQTGKVRALLCHRCNTVYTQHMEKHIDDIIRYHVRHGGRTDFRDAIFAV